MTGGKQYNFFLHRHKFAVWAAAHATQRHWKGATTEIKRKAIESSDVFRQFVVTESSARETTTDEFEQLHRKWCGQILVFMEQAHVPTTYGHAAKLVAVYLKSMLILSGPEDCPLARSAHPPIDRTLLQNLAKALNKNDPCYRHKAYLSKVSWTTLSEDRYFELIEKLRKMPPGEQPLWKFERFWDESKPT